MPVAEPSGAFGLWPRVRAITGWPESNEDLIALLGHGWRSAAGAFAGAGEHDLSAVPAHWPDAAGAAFGTRAGTTLGRATAVATDMTGLADRADRFAAELTGVKTGIVAVIDANLPAFASLQALPEPFRGATEQGFVVAVAAIVDGLIAGAEARVSGAPAPAQPPPPEPLPEEDPGLAALPADALRALGDLYTADALLLDNAVDGYVESSETIGGAMTSLGGFLGGDPAVVAEGQRIIDGADAKGDAVADALVENAANERNALYEQAESIDGRSVPVEVYLSADRYPESLDHIYQARSGQIWTGLDWHEGQPKPEVLTVDRDAATRHRRESLAGIPRGAEVGKVGYDRDEYPLAATEEGGAGASVKLIPAGDNRGAGSTIGNQIRNLDEGDQFIIVGTD